MDERAVREPWRRALPRVSAHAVLRPRVADQFDRRLPLTVLAAPHGYGKSVAMVNWLRLAHTDDDLVFWLDIVPGTGADAAWAQVLAGLTGAAAPDVPSAYDVLDGWLAGGDDTVVLAVDSSQNMIDHSFLDRLVALLRRHSRLYAIVATRQLTTALVDIAHAVDTLVMDQRDLTFRADDSLVLFGSYGLGEYAEQCMVLHEAVNGWPTLVHRGAIAISELLSQGNHLRIRAVLNDVTDRTRDYISATMLPELITPDQVELAQRCALVGTLDSRSVALLADPDDPCGEREVADIENAVRDLARSGVLTSRRELDQVTWSMPNLVASALREQHGVPGERATALQRRFIEHHLEQEEWPQAVSVALLLDDPEVLADLMARGWPFLSMTHDPLLRDAFARIPQRVLDAHPVALSTKGLVFNAETEAHHDELPDDPEELDRLAVDPGVTGLMLEHLTIMLAHRTSGRLAQALEASERLVRLVEAVSRVRPRAAENIAPAIHAQAGVTRQLVGDMAGSDTHFRRVLAVGGDDPSETAVRNAEACLALNEALEGRLSLAQEWVDKARRHPDYPGWLGRRLLTPRLIAEAWIALDGLDQTTIAPLLGQLAAQSDDDELWGHIVTVQSMHDLVFEDSWTAIDHLQSLRRRRGAAAPPGSYADLALTFALADHQLVLGQATRAGQTLLAAPAQHPGSGVRRATIALLSGDPDGALAETFTGQRVSIRRRAHVALLRACAHLDLGDIDAARASAEQSLRRMQAYGLRTPLRFVPAERLADLLDRVELTAADRDLIRDAIDSNPSPLPATVDVILLTDRERVVLDGLVKGWSAQQMADASVVSVNTIKSQARTLYRKLDASSRSEALSRAREVGLIAESAESPRG